VARGSIVNRPSRVTGERVYYVKYQLPDGRQKWERVGRNKKEAERVLADRLNAIGKGTYQELREATFAEFAAKWLAEYAEPRLKPSTLDGYRRYLDGHLIPAFGGFPLRALTTGLIQDFVSGLHARGLSGKSVNNIAVPLKLMLRHAVSWGYLASNPAAAVERARVETKEMQALSPEQVRRFLAATEPEYWLLFTVAVFTGVRRGELLALQWGDVDWQTARLNIRRSLWRGQFIGPKTVRSVRSIDLAPQVLGALDEARPARPPEELKSQLIFSGPHGKPLDPDNLVKRRFLPTLERAELPRIRFHDLRHTHASLLIAAGEHPKYVQHQLGHASITTTLDRYGHLLPGAYQHAGERLERTVLGDGQLPRP
jgi:integrase